MNTDVKPIGSILRTLVHAAPLSSAGQHLGGDWQTVSVADPERGVVIFIGSRVGDMGRMIAELQISGDGHDYTETDYANGNLLAAAPRLLGQLQEAYDLLVDSKDAQNPEHPAFVWRHTTDLLLSGLRSKGVVAADDQEGAPS